MALNWVMLDKAGQRPLPLPQEQVLMQVGKTSLQLDFANEKISYKADGLAIISSHRFVFLRQPPPPQSSSSSSSPGTLNTLSIPLDHILSHKYVIPIFTAPYIEADIYGVHGGGLPERQPGQTNPPVGKLKIWFMESGGLNFRDAVDRAKRIYEQNRLSAREDEDALRE